MPADVIAWAMANPQIVLSAILGAVLLAWAYEAYDEAEDRLEAAKGFGARAKSGTGGVLNVVLVSLVSVVGWAATTFETAGGAVTFVLSLVPDAPVLTASIVSIGLGTLGLSDVIVLRTVHFVGFSAIALLIALAFRMNLDEVGR